MIDQQKVIATIEDTTKLFMASRLTGNECSLVLQTLVAHMLANNSPKITRDWIDALRRDIVRRKKSA